LPEPEADPQIEAAPDRKSLRGLLAARGEGRSPRQIEAEVERLWAAREIRANLLALRGVAVDVQYEAVDVRDEARFGRLIEAIYEQFGRIDGVVHAAGVLEDKLLSQKTGESFDRVFDTKVKGARVIARHLRPGAAFVVFFGSVSGVFGNRGQVDYSAANDALDKLARSSNGRLARRVLCIDWGPWGGGGMVSPELEREYARRGIGLIDPEQGARAMVDELRFGDPSEAQVLYMCGSPESLT
jgi:NAD(P)-dependent dehydrogenase (short-subunit alcohol dehydrogenase family)